MPSYDLKCKECEAEETRIMRMFQLDDIEPCAACSGDMKIVIRSAPTTILKGRGWYRDGYSSKSKNSVTEKEVERYEATGQAGF